MTVEEVKKRVAAIIASSGDPEAAHSMEDDLYVAVLQGIVDGDADGDIMAREALKVRDIDFPRWCA